MRVILTALLFAAAALPARAQLVSSGSSAGFKENDRSTGQTWLMYSNSGILRISSTNATTDAFTMDAVGHITTAGMTASSITLSGVITGPKGIADASSPINFSTGNAHYTTSNCGAFALWNLKDGGNYTFVVKGTGVGTCSFTGYSDSGSTSVTMHPPPDLGATVSGKHTVFNITVVGSDAYIAWTPGY